MTGKLNVFTKSDKMVFAVENELKNMQFMAVRQIGNKEQSYMLTKNTSAAFPVAHHAHRKQRTSQATDGVELVGDSELCVVPFRPTPASGITSRALSRAMRRGCAALLGVSLSNLTETPPSKSHVSCQFDI